MIRILLFTLIFFSFLNAQNLINSKIKLEDLSGETYQLSSFIGKAPVYINFWALWCVPCRSELKPLNAIYEKFKDKGFEVLSINIDNVKSTSKVSSFIASQKISFKVFLDPESKIFKFFNGENIPFSILVDKEGNVKKVRTGYLPGDEKKIEEEIELLLKEE